MPGSEGEGLSDAVKSECDILLYVKGSKLSNKTKASVPCLNVSSASGSHSYTYTSKGQLRLFYPSIVIIC